MGKRVLESIFCLVLTLQLEFLTMLAAAFALAVLCSR